MLISSNDKSKGLTKSKWMAVRSFINTWLKEPECYCATCGFPYFNSMDEPCCKDPRYGTNLDHMIGLLKQNREMREKATEKDTAANKDNNMRWGVSILPKLLADLEDYFEKNYHEKLWNNDKELKEFMRAFPEFRIARKV